MNDTATRRTEEALARVQEAQEAARKAEREFLLLTGWEAQGTYNGVTWWYREPFSTAPQADAVHLEIYDQQREERQT